MFSYYPVAAIVNEYFEKSEEKNAVLLLNRYFLLNDDRYVSLKANVCCQLGDYQNPTLFEKPISNRDYVQRGFAQLALYCFEGALKDFLLVQYDYLQQKYHCTSWLIRSDHVQHNFLKENGKVWDLLI